MKITFLGTAAAEGIPSLYCNCNACKLARKIKGKEIRKRSSLLINDDLIIDMGPDLSLACLENNISLDNLKYALITHCHFDHFYPENLEIRSKRYQPKNFPKLTLLANSSVFYRLSQLGYKDEELYINRVEAIPYNSYNFGGYIVKPIFANHAHEYGMSLNYIIVHNNKTILYATDTGIYEDKWIELLYGNKIDCLIIDATNIFSSTSKNHLNIDGIREMKNKLLNKKIIDDDTRIICTHFSHYNLPSYNELRNRLEKDRFIISYDGMVMKI